MSYTMMPLPPLPVPFEAKDSKTQIALLGEPTELPSRGPFNPKIWILANSLEKIKGTLPRVDALTPWNQASSPSLNLSPQLRQQACRPADPMIVDKRTKLNFVVRIFAFGKRIPDYVLSRSF